MFSNQLSAKDLYSTNPSQFLVRSAFHSTDQEDSAISSSQTMSQSNSQMMTSSQMENSQSSSYDLFSQMISQQTNSLSQPTENSSNPQRFYMKYMSKPPLFNKESDKNPALLPMSKQKGFQEQLQINKQKAKERDDRDLINTFISLVKECTEDVKSASQGIRQDVDTGLAASADRFNSLIQKINEDMNAFHQTLLSAVQCREDQQATLERLRQDIAARDAKIEVLETQLAHAGKQGEERVVQSLLEAYSEQQALNRDHMGKMQAEQRTFCQAQMEQLQQDQQQYLRQCESEREAAAAKAAAAAEAVRVSQSEAGVASGGASGNWSRSGPPGLGGDIQSQHEQTRWHGSLTGRFPNLATHPCPSAASLMHSNNAVSGGIQPGGGHPANPATAPFPFGIQGSFVSHPTPSTEWSAPSLCTSGQINLPSAATHHQQMQGRPAVPSGTGFTQPARPAGFNLQQAAPSMIMSPPGAPAQSIQWSLNKVKPSPVAAVAPQVKASEATKPPQEKADDDIRDQAPDSEASKPQQTKGKNKKKNPKYQVAVKTRKKSARLKAKQSCSSEGTVNANSKPQQELSTTPQPSKRGKHTDATQTDCTKQAESIAGSHQSQVSYEKPPKYREEVKRGKAVAKEKQSVQCKRRTSSSSSQAGKHLLCAQEMNELIRQPAQVRVIRRQTKVTSEDVYRFTEPEKEGLNLKVRRNRGHKWNPPSKKHLITDYSQQDSIFSQKRARSYGRSRDVTDNANKKISSRHQETIIVQARHKGYPTPEIACDGSSSSDEDYCESQRRQLEAGTEVNQAVVVKQNTRPVNKKARKSTQPLTKTGDKSVSSHKQMSCLMKTMSPYSSQDDDDSSEETAFSLRLPNSPPWCPSLHQQERNCKQTVEQVVPSGTFDILSTPYIHRAHGDEDGDGEDSLTHGPPLSVCVGSGKPAMMSRQTERKRRLSHYALTASSSSPSAAATMLEITNSLRRQHGKVRRVSSAN